MLNQLNLCIYTYNYNYIYCDRYDRSYVSTNRYLYRCLDPNGSCQAAVGRAVAHLDLGQLRDRTPQLAVVLLRGGHKGA